MSAEPAVTQFYGGIPAKTAQHATGAVVSGPGTVLLPMNAPPVAGKVKGMISLDEAMAHVPALAREIGEGALGRNEPALRTISALASRTSSGRQWPISLSAANRLKRAEQLRAHRAYRALDSGKVTQVSPRAQFAQSVAQGTREALEREVPSLGLINSRTQGLMGLERAAEHAAGTGHILSRLVGAGTGLSGVLVGSGGGLAPAIAGAAAGSMLATPGGLSRLGLLARTGGQIAPHAVRLALMAMLAGEQPPE